jgi:Ni,Fe-hydrogenase III small subunit
MWALRGLRNGVLTSRWPARPDSYAAATRGPATVLAGKAGAAGDLAGKDGAAGGGDLAGKDGAAGDLAGKDGAAGDDGLARLCPTGAISNGPSGQVRVDQGRCILCGRCVAARPDVFGWSAGPDSAALTRAGLVVPRAESAQALADISGRLRARTRALRRSVHLRHVDTGSDGTEEWEILALLNPVYDIHRLGMFFTASPRHADILLATGPGAHGMAGPLLETYEAMPHPKVVIAVGTDAVGGGIVSPSYPTSGGVGGIVPVDVWVPGSPPAPFAILSALLLALGRLRAPARAGDQR